MHKDLEDTTMKTGLFVWFSAMLVCVPTITAADKRGATENKLNASILVEPDELEKHLNDKNLRVLDMRSQNEYAKGHIPGALRVDVGDWKKLATSDLGLHDAKGWTEKVSPLGLRKGMHVVIYGSRLSDTARIWWLLKYVGVKNASILNGGWEWWIKKDRPIETSTPRIAATEFKPDFQADRLEKIGSLKKSLKSLTVKVVDTRSIGEFSGGRIPGSAHLEWKELIAEDGRFKTKTQLQQLFRQRGIVPSKTAVCY
jgi:thiosulfate/3-mercaptopyruvate sulfurtransferase